MADKTIFGVLLLTAFVTAVYGGEWCTDLSHEWFDTDQDTFWCESSCCGDAYDRHCCIDGEAGMIIGIVIGCLVLAGVVVSIVVAICCCRRRRARQGQVVGGAGAVNMGATVPPYTTTMNYPAGYPQMQQTTIAAYPQMPANQPYGQPPAGNQAYGQPPAGNLPPYGQPAPAQGAPGNQQGFAQAPPSYDELQHNTEPK